jgi:chemotaxis protein CheC
MTQYSELELDALREVANIGSGTAATALSSMIGLPVDVTVPLVSALPLAEAIDAIGDPEQVVTAVALGVFGDAEGHVLLLFTPDASDVLCGLLGVEAGTDIGLSALGEIGNILGSSYLTALGTMTGMHLEPHPPATATDMLGAVAATVLASSCVDTDTALLLDSGLDVEGTACDFTFMLVPTASGVADLLVRLGVGA